MDVSKIQELTYLIKTSSRYAEIIIWHLLSFVHSENSERIAV